MKFSATFLSLALLLAGSAEAHAHVKNHHRRQNGPSATFGGQTPATPTVAAPTTADPTPTGGNLNTTPGTIKRGLSFNDVGLTKGFSSQEVNWAYNWAASHDGSLPDSVKFLPMLWSADSIYTTNWNDDATAAIASGSTYLLGFNEPDLGSQANMSPEAAAAAWKTYMEPFSGKATLVSPAITNGGAPMGTAWLESFFAACTGCNIGAVAIHIYDSATNVVYYQNYIRDVAAKFNKPILLTEFGASGSLQDQQNFLSQMVPFLDGLDAVTHYAYFGCFVGTLVNADSTLNALGNTYISA